GILGMPRRYFDYSTFEKVNILAFWNLLATIGAFVMAISVLAFIINMVYSLRSGPPAGEDPFNLAMESTSTL
ncbi:MAG: cytochrome ubiquinol oxidase subunit I, partial [Candidatus Hodarchaeota archaeon]